jgi:hypothetical protein
MGEAEPGRGTIGFDGTSANPFRSSGWNKGLEIASLMELQKK